MSNLSSEIKYAIRRISNLVLFLSLFMAVSCNSSELELKSNAQVIKTPEVKDSVEQEAIKLTKLYNNKDCREFIKAFPNTFEEFNELYGYDDDKGARLLYSKSYEHITFFSECSEVSDLEKLNKVIRIGINGKWDADAPEFLQVLAFNLIKNYPSETKEILDNLPDNDAASFWFFLFDGPHPNHPQKIKDVQLLNNLLGKNSKQSKLLLEQHKKLVVEWSEH